MLIHETHIFLGAWVKSLHIDYKQFMDGKMSVDDYETAYRSALETIRDIAIDQIVNPNFGQPYTLNDGTVIKNKEERPKDRMIELQGKIYYDVDPDFA